MNTPLTHSEERFSRHFIIAGPDRIGNAFAWPCFDIPSGQFAIAELSGYMGGGSGPCTVDAVHYGSLEAAHRALLDYDERCAMQERDTPDEEDERLAI